MTLNQKLQRCDLHIAFQLEMKQRLAEMTAAGIHTKPDGTLDWDFYKDPKIAALVRYVRVINCFFVIQHLDGTWLKLPGCYDAHDANDGPLPN